MASRQSIQERFLGGYLAMAVCIYSCAINSLLYFRRRTLNAQNWLHAKTGLGCFDFGQYQREQDSLSRLMRQAEYSEAQKPEPAIVFSRPFLRTLHWVLTEPDLSRLTPAQLIYRCTKASTGLKSTAELPDKFQTPRFVGLLLSKMMANSGSFPVAIETRWYWHPKTFKWLWSHQIPPKNRINATFCDPEILTWLFNRIAPRRSEDTDPFNGGTESRRGFSRGNFVAQWFDIHSFDMKTKEHYMTHVVDALPRGESWLDAFLTGVEKYPNYCLDKLDGLTGEYQDRAIAHCNDRRVRFQLSTNDTQSKLLLNLVGKGLDASLLDVLELSLANRRNFLPLDFNPHVLHKLGRSYLNHLSVLIEKGLDDVELADIERYFIERPQDIDKLDKRHVTEAIAKARLDHDPSPAIAMIYEHCYPAIWAHFVARHKKSIAKLHIDPKMTRTLLESFDKDPDFPSEYVPKDIPPALAKAQTKHAKNKGNYLELAGLRRCDIKAVLACARTTADFSFINEFIADKSGDRLVDLYPDALKEQILCEELGL